MHDLAITLGIVKDPALLITLAPLGILFLGVITFEVAMGVTISTLPRSRFNQRWTPQEHRRVLRVFGVVFSIWPITVTLILAHVFMPMWLALMADAMVLVMIAACIRWWLHSIQLRKLVLSGHCENCFYDLRASRESDACPECGVELHNHPVRVTAR